jgi:hypothetical protein
MRSTINNLINRGLYMRSTTRKTRGQEISYPLTLNIFNISLMGGRVLGGRV